jgi:hypothetical protein
MGGWTIAFGILLALFWVLSLSIWVGVYVGIWKPYFDIDWRESECMVQNITTYRWIVSDDYGEADVFYTSINLLVNVNSHWVQGFACGVPDSYQGLLGDVDSTGSYSYQHSICPASDVCGRMQFLPRWYCSDCETCSEKLTGKSQSCHWTVSPGAQNTDPSEWPLGYRLERPLMGSSYSEVVLRDEVYYSQGEYVFLHIFGAFGIIVPPLLALTYLAAQCINKHKQQLNQS